MTLQIGKTNFLKIQARFEVRKLGLPDRVLIAIYTAIDRVRLPFTEFLNATNKDIIEAFISRVMAGLTDIEEKYKEDIKKCLIAELY